MMIMFLNKRKGTQLLTTQAGALKASERLLTLLDGLLNRKRTACSISPDRMGKMGWNNHNKLL